MASKTKQKFEFKQLTHLIEIVKRERSRFLIGVCITFVSAFIFLGQVSFLFTGAEDQSKVENRTFFELISEKQEIENWTGVSGAFVAERLINGWIGIFSILISFFFVALGLHLIRAINISYKKWFALTTMLVIWGSLFSAFVLSAIFGDSHIVWGGAHGKYIVEILEKAIGIPGVIMLILLFFIIFWVMANKSSVVQIQNWISKLFARKPKVKKVVEDDDEDEDEELRGLTTIKHEGIVLSPEDYEMPQPKGNAKQNNISPDDDFEIYVPKEDEVTTLPKPEPEEEEQIIDDDGEQMEEYDPTADLSRFSFPSFEMLNVYESGDRVIDMEEQNENKNKIITTLQNYGIEITSIKATVGPTITLYEIVPKAGVRISKIRNLEDDIALSLSALGIRIIAPMPGKGTVGIEVPNKDPQVVSMRSVIASKKFQECNYDLPVALGRTITNEVFTFDLAKMPHLLVAGATGQGKSVGLNAIITSLLYKKHPAEMKMVLVDPKMVEFSIYSTIEKHYLAKLPDAEKAIITDVSKVIHTLNSLTVEMDDRYRLLMEAGVRNIKEYNGKFKKRRLSPLKGHRFLPYIVVIIDEFGDLIMTAGKEIEMPIARIAQKARAVGMHMIIATQRPTTNIITGTIKANFPARMAFRVTSQIDSRTILDMSGANQLIGRGDMLFSQGSDLVRIQCAFVDTPEVDEITKYIGDQQGYACAHELPEWTSDAGEDRGEAFDSGEKDSLFEEAARLIVIQQQGSTSLIQRKFSIGYNRAGRIMDQLEGAGIVGSPQGSKPREVLISDEYSLEQKLSSM